MKYRKKPFVIDALQFTGGNCRDVLRFSGSPHWDNIELHDTDNPVIRTEEGERTMRSGDYLMKGDGGELYIRSEFFFTQIYEPASEDA